MSTTNEVFIDPNKIAEITGIQLKVAGFLSAVQRQSFIKPAEFHYPDIQPDGEYNPAEWSIFLGELGYKSHRWGLLRLAWIAVSYNVRIVDKNNKTYFK